MKTQVAIIGGGPSGLLLAHLLDDAGIDTVVLERRTKAHVLSRIRAGVLEAGTVDLLRRIGLGTRMDAEGHVHDGVHIHWPGFDPFTIDTTRETGKSMMAYGQTRITEDLYAAREAAGGRMVFGVTDATLHDLMGRPHVTFTDAGGNAERLDCDFIAGCDGFQGVSRRSIPGEVLKTYEKVYPFGWLGVLADVPPLPEIAYFYHPDGFALASQRGPAMARYYVQCAADDRVEDWPDDRFWDTLKHRLPPHLAEQVVTGPSTEKSIAPLRSFVAEPMQYGRLYLAGDAAHIVPPTGAKGLNLAVADAVLLSRGLIAHYRDGDDAALAAYSDTALERVWGAVRLSWWLTTLLHVFPGEDTIEDRLRTATFRNLTRSPAARADLATQFVGLPY